MMIAFKTNKKRPKEKSVIGMVRINKIGFRNAFRKVSTKATINAAEKPTKCTPGIKYATMIIEIAEIKIRKKKFFI